MKSQRLRNTRKAFFADESSAIPVVLYYLLYGTSLHACMA
jgi:hypothetical protein